MWLPWPFLKERPLQRNPNTPQHQEKCSITAESISPAVVAEDGIRAGTSAGDVIWCSNSSNSVRKRTGFLFRLGGEAAGGGLAGLAVFFKDCVEHFSQRLRTRLNVESNVSG